jgi:hypothetical protein
MRVKVAFSEIAVNPVRNVQRAVCAEREEIMGSNGLRFARSLQHKQLRQNRDGLEPDGEGPQDLNGISSQLYPTVLRM